jgi:formylglycine-generating enzyme required for sulfatase activity
VNPRRRPPTHLVEHAEARVPGSPTGSPNGSSTRDPGTHAAHLSLQWLQQVFPLHDEVVAEAQRRWRIATGLETGNPEEGDAPRSKVWRHQPDPAGPAEWHKEYQPKYAAFSAYEQSVLQHLGSADGSYRSPRDFHAQMTLLKAGDRSTRLNYFVTLDAGPNLMSWEYFRPLTRVGRQGWVLPLFAHPLFLAAMVHRLLLALEVLHEHQVIHLDLKPENIGLALPALHWQDGHLNGQWPLQALPLKLLDFECSVRLGFPYPSSPPNNAYVSPFARQRLLQAMGHPYNAGWAQGVDWGADLYALGHMLTSQTPEEDFDWSGWVPKAQRLLAYYRVPQRQAFADPLAYIGSDLDQETEQLLDDLHWLARFGHKLMALDRPANQATLPPEQLDQLPPRRPQTLASLRHLLAQRFPALQDGARPVHLPFFLATPGLVWTANPPSPSPSPSPKPTPLRWQDLQEIHPPGTAPHGPSFILIPNPGPVTLGAGEEALSIHMHHRYAMGKTPVTVGQWKVFWNAPDRDYTPVETEKTCRHWDDKNFADNDRKPVIGVNVLDAEAYVRWFNRRCAAELQAQIGRPVVFDLPTEVEWELAARGGRYTQDYLWADGASGQEKCRHAQIGDCPGNTVAVGRKLANGYGLYDMVGNVWEWQSSPWRDKRSELPSNGLEEQAAGVSVSRSVRGASFHNDDDGLRLAYRNWNSPGYRYNIIGFRLVARIASA